MRSLDLDLLIEVIFRLECLDQIAAHNAFSIEAPIRRNITPVRVTYRFTYNCDDSRKPSYTLRPRPPCALVYCIHAVYTRVYGEKDGQTVDRPMRRRRRPTQWLHKQTARLHASDLGPSPPPPTASHRPYGSNNVGPASDDLLCIRTARSLASNAHRPPFLPPPTDRRTDQDLHALHWTAAVAAATELPMKYRRGKFLSSRTCIIINFLRLCSDEIGNAEQPSRDPVSAVGRQVGDIDPASSGGSSPAGSWSRSRHRGFCSSSVVWGFHETI